MRHIIRVRGERYKKIMPPQTRRHIENVLFPLAATQLNYIKMICIDTNLVILRRNTSIKIKFMPSAS